MSDQEFFTMVWGHIVYLASWLWGEIMYWVDWLSIDKKAFDLSFFISVSALIVSLRMFFLYRKEISLIQKQLSLEQERQEQDLLEKKKRTLTFSIARTEVYGGSDEYPLRKMGVWLLVNNRGIDQILLSRVAVFLDFKKQYWGTVSRDFFSILKSLFREILSKFQEFSLSFWMYHSSITASYSKVRDIDYSFETYKGFYLINWETKRPIYFRPEQGYRLPDPGKKEVWFLLAIFPEEDAKVLYDENLYLQNIKLRFETDEGMKFAEKEIIGFLKPEDVFGNEEESEWSDYIFEYETVPTALIFGG